jgi:hypothetical protein
MRYIFAALMYVALAGSAHAQTGWTAPVNPEYSYCCAGGACWYEKGSVCHSDPALRTLMSTSGTTYILITPTCPTDREVVVRASGEYGCAKDVQSPE